MSIFKSLSYLSIIILAVALYLGFDVLFEKVRTDTAKEVVIASLGAIFVLLSTKLLMEKESENRLGEERRRSLYKDNLNDYRIAADNIMRILKDDQLNHTEIYAMREVYAKLVLLGSKDAIEKSRKFIEKCYEYLETDDSPDEILTLSQLQAQELWILALDFLSSARKSLEIEHDSFDFASESKSFRELNKRQSLVKLKKLSARQELNGGVAEWVMYKNFPHTLTEYVERFIKQLNVASPSIGIKCTPTQISFFDKTSSNQLRIMYLNSYNRRENSLVFSFNSAPDKEFFEKLCADLSSFKAYVREPKKNGKFDAVFYLPLGKITEEDLSVIFSYIEKFKRKFNQ